MYEQTRNEYHRAAGSRAHAAGQLHWLEMSFTSKSLSVLKEYRRQLALQTGKTVTLGVALDQLIKSHPAASEV